ncbi:hypothetical protein [Lysobacter solisilvae (ex Woo and Kim 2020)]|uniref:Uncharacterized protein n=1 Tax=Agrilutibacter terrestris TaxID=2865112 RepID=A0A7H0FUY7_9GAMM|nr:hypothetical protein [Lysobacter terrestris]QNP39853.1 hypothetical protein H8B22_10080 [Lysobacter terrestris]
MSSRGWLALLLLVAVAGWWFSPLSPRTPRGYERIEAAPVAITTATPATTMTATGCPLPPRVAAFEAPLQTDPPASLPPFRLRAATLTPLAGFSIDARVLSRREYRSDREAALAPVDLALGWGRMRDDAVLQRLTITQSARWYHYRYGGEPPIPQREIERSAANMHLIPGSAAIASALRDVDAGSRVRIDGWLVEARAADGWRWRSSTTREDAGAGACELIYVCAITRL